MVEPEPTDVPFTVVHDPRPPQEIHVGVGDGAPEPREPIVHPDDDIPLDRRRFVEESVARELPPGWVQTWGMRWRSAGRRDAFFLVFGFPVVVIFVSLAWSLGKAALHIFTHWLS